MSIRKCPELQTWEKSKKIDFGDLSRHGTERVNGVREKNFCAQTFFFSINKQVRIIFRKMIFRPGVDSWVQWQAISQNLRFSLNVFNILEGRNSLNFGCRRKVRTFLEFSDIKFSKRWRFNFGFQSKNVQIYKPEKKPKTSIVVSYLVIAMNV